MFKLSIHDISLLRCKANEEMLSIPNNGTLKGMKRSLTLGERQAIAFYKASISLLNSKGANISVQFEKDIAEIVNPDSLPDTEDL